MTDLRYFAATSTVIKNDPIYPEVLAMNRKPRIVVVGSSNTDMVVKTARIPTPGETVLGGEFLMTGGGKGANQAVAAARLGAEVTFVAKVGMDLFGEQAVHEIRAAGVNTEYVTGDPETPSGVALIFVEESGQNSIVVAPGANASLAPADVEAARPAFEQADVVVLQLEVPILTVAYAIRLAKDLGKRVILNPAPATALPSGFLNGVDVLTPNEIEAAMLLGAPPGADFQPAAAARALLKEGVGAVVVTVGAEGAIIVEAERSDRIVRVKSHPVIPVDTTAAGDCFTGALAVGMAEGMLLAEAAGFANTAASVSVTRLGAQASMPSRNDVEQVLSEFGHA